MISGNANNMNYWQGWIDEVRIWGVAHTQEQIQGAMYGPLTGKEAGLLGYWNFEEGYGGEVALDVTSGGHNGTLKNGVTWSTLNAPGNAPPIKVFTNRQDFRAAAGQYPRLVDFETFPNGEEIPAPPDPHGKATYPLQGNEFEEWGFLLSSPLGHRLGISNFALLGGNKQLAPNFDCNVGQIRVDFRPGHLLGLPGFDEGEREMVRFVAAKGIF